MKPSTLAFAATAALSLCAGAARAQPPTSYRLAATVPLGAPDRWDYVVDDEAGGRVYVAHGDRLTVIDARALKVVGEVTGLDGAHGIYVSHASGLGFTDSGQSGQAEAFDLKTLKVGQTFKAAADADAVAGDPRSGRVFVMNGDTGTITVLDALAPKGLDTIQVGGSLEYAAVDGAGNLYVNGAERSEIVRIDIATDKVTARWAVPDCKSPHGMAIDPKDHRLFTSCVNGRLIVVDTGSGREVATAPIGQGTDAAAYDPVRRRVLSSNGRDGTISVIQQVDADTYRPLAPVQTQVSARTMAIEPSTGRLFVAAADVDPAAAPSAAGKRKFVPGSLKLLVYAPVP